jgi:DNA-binding response OmpR family regulator
MNSEKRGYSILYVEDNEEVLQTYAAFMSRSFEDVYIARDAKEAMEIYKNQKPDILVIDIRLSEDESGIDFLRKIRKDDHHTRAIMLTGMGDVDTLLKATELKLTKYLLKPISRDDLSAALDMAVEEIENFAVQTRKVAHVGEGAFWDYEKEAFVWNNKEVPLTKKERELLKLLFSNVNKVFATEDIIFELWYDYDELKIASLKTLVKTLRKKLPEGMIKNVFGVGYKIDA